MAKFSEVEFKGKSGKIYRFEIYPLDDTFDTVEAVYIVTIMFPNQRGRLGHGTIYIGNTDNMQEWHKSHNKSACFQKENASHVGIYLEPDANEREAIQNDLMQSHNFLCND